jgi:glycine oxidase
VSASVVIVGGGVMGCACAWELAARGFRVVVLERSVPGAVASSAAAGILGAQVEAHAPGALARLSAESRRLYPRWANALTRATGIDVELRTCGVVRVAYQTRELKRYLARAAWQSPRPRALGRAALLRREPALSPRLAGGVLFERDARVDPRALLKALRIAAARSGARFRSGAYVRSIVRKRDRATGVLLDDGKVVSGDHVIVAAGSWTTLVGGVGLDASAVVPVRGQIVELETPEPLISSIVFGPRAYLVPRDDGRLLVGSTMEFVGYRREVTAGAVRDLLGAALDLVPALESSVLRSTWSSFRPYTKDELPLIGRGDRERLWLATGHHRNGILLAPVTASIIGALVRGRKPPVALAPFEPSRGRGATPML